MKLALALALAAVTAAYLGWRVTRAAIRAVRRFRKVQATLDTIVDLGEAHLLERPHLALIDDRWLCLGCTSPSQPTSIWCKVCGFDEAPATPIETQDGAA
jgi:hypothetical protein